MRVGPFTVTPPRAAPYLSLDFFVVLAAAFFGPPCLDFAEP
ncbi:MAG TPA: hypothetical protein VER08_05005 [Pyrinomonadaceae bacterium]|nr:hypothetical protein [Pyrinomonadaceae bacterium]